MLKWLRKQLVVREWIKLALISVLIMAVVVLMLREPAEPVPPVNLSVPAKPAPEVKHKPKVEKPIKTKKVKVYAPEVKKDLKLPEVVQDDPALDVIASHQVKPDDHPQTVTTLLNTETGESETYVKRDPLPWLARSDRGEVGLALGFKNAEPAVRLEGRQELFQVKAVHFGVTGSVDQQLNGAEKTDWFVGVGAWYRW
jgi:hypothetical protein